MAAGADALGLNFVPSSVRCIDTQTAQTIACAIGSSAFRVGVFANQSSGEIHQILSRVSLDAVQLHGHEPVALWHELPLPLIRAYRTSPGIVATILEELATGARDSVSPWAVLLDAYTPAAVGGTGKLADWTTASELLQQLPQAESAPLPPLVLAGGLTPRNVAEAIARVRPAAVDTASGVESAPAVKDAQLMREFVAAARGAFAKLP